MISLELNGVSLALTKDEYREGYSNVDKRQMSEGGTTLRSVTRLGILTLAVSYKCDGLEKARLENFSKMEMLTATLYDEVAHSYKTWQCYMDDFSAKLLVEDESERFYRVSFKLYDLTAS